MPTNTPITSSAPEAPLAQVSSREGLEEYFWLSSIRVAGLTYREFRTAAHRRAMQCPCDACTQLAGDTFRIFSLALMALAGPVSPYERQCLHIVETLRNDPPPVAQPNHLKN